MAYAHRAAAPTCSGALLALAMLFLCVSGAFAGEQPAPALAVYVPSPAAWITPPIRPEGFQFEIQISSLGTAYDPERVRHSIRAHDLGEYDSAVSKTMAAEWGYSFTHLDGQVDGAGRPINAGYPTPPQSRAECLAVIEDFLHRQYIRGAEHPWSSMNGHYPWHHYAAEFGFDQIGSEIGENINNYQWHIALNRGAARQYRRPWFIDFSAWHGPGITDYSGAAIWGDYSHQNHGHSMSLFERSLFMSYMAGAGQLTAEAGGAIAFLPALDEQGRYRLSPYGEVCRRFRQFSREHPDIGIPCTPFAVVLDFYHGAYPGFGPCKAFHHFEYTPGDRMTWDLINLIWPGGWEVMGKEEVGTLVNGPYGDTVDVLLQNASQEVLNSYPCLILSGEIALTEEEAQRYRRYVEQGGTLMLNTAYRAQFAEWVPEPAGGEVAEIRHGKGRVLVYGPDHSVAGLDPLIRAELARLLPVRVEGDVQYLVNIAAECVFVTLINNAGISKAFHEPPVVDPAQARTVTVVWTADAPLHRIRRLDTQHEHTGTDASSLSVTLSPGSFAIVAFYIE